MHPAVGDRRPAERALERGGVQLVARIGDAQQCVLLAEFADDRSTRSANGARWGCRTWSLGRNAAETTT